MSSYEGTLFREELSVKLERAIGSDTIELVSLIGHYPDHVEGIINLPCIGTDGHTPLTYACYVGTSTTIKKLQQGSPDFKLRDGKGRTALITAAQNKDSERSLEVTKYLFNLKPSIGGFNCWKVRCQGDVDGNTALIYAAGLGYLKVVKIQIGDEDVPNRRRCVNIKNVKGETALSMAMLNSHDEVAKFLLSAGAEATGAGCARALLKSISEDDAEMTDAMLSSRKDWGRAEDDVVMLGIAAADEHGLLLVGKLIELVLACAEGALPSRVPKRKYENAFESSF